MDDRIVVDEIIEEFYSVIYELKQSGYDVEYRKNSEYLGDNFRYHQDAVELT